MLKNYITVALRNITRYKAYSFLIIFGLALGIAVFILAVLYSGYNSGFDSFHHKADSIHMVVRVIPSGNKGEQHTTYTPLPLMPALQAEFPEIQAATRFSRNPRTIIRNQDQSFYESNILTVDPDFLSFFNFIMKKGNPLTVLSQPNSILLSEDSALKYFGETDPLGKILTLDNSFDVIVSGILENSPDNSCIKYDFMLSMETTRNLYNWTENWEVNDLTTFIRVPQGKEATRMQAKLPAFLGKYYPDLPESPKSMYLLPLLEYRRQVEALGLRSNLMAGTPYVTAIFLVGMAIVLLLIVCINFMNLSTARYMQRAKEIGLRKVVGATRLKLITQFLGESVLLSFIAIPLALLLFLLLKPAFIAAVNHKMQLSLAHNPELGLVILAGILLIGVFAGSYPAFYLSAFKPIHILKGDLQVGKKGTALRKILVVSQFSLSILMLVFTVAIANQLKYLVHMDNGFNKKQVLTVTIPNEAQGRLESFKKSVAGLPHIQGVSASQRLPINWKPELQVLPEGYDENDPWTMAAYGVDYDFIELLGLQILEGKSFSRDFQDKNSFILNETAVQQLQWENPIGKELKLGEKEGVVIGVAQDFLFDNAHWKIEPSVLYLENHGLGYLLIKASDITQTGTISLVRQEWQAFFPNLPFNYSTLETRFDTSYNYIKGMYQVFGAVGVFAIFISCLGLVAMAFYTVGRRTKEIGVRKVLGASVPGIVRLLLFGFLKLVIIANLLAWPLTYVLVKQFMGWAWAYRTDVSVMVFMASAVVTLAMAILSVVYQTVKVSLSNPAEALRYE